MIINLLTVNNEITWSQIVKSIVDNGTFYFQFGNNLENAKFKNPLYNSIGFFVKSETLIRMIGNEFKNWDKTTINVNGKDFTHFFNPMN